MRVSVITPVYVERMPDRLDDGHLYISESRNLALHKCCCGCGEEVVTPLNSKAGWQVIKDGHKVSLYPSIGNWNFACQSHYWIKNNRVEWSYQMTSKEIVRVQARDLKDTQAHIAQQNAMKGMHTKASSAVTSKPKATASQLGWFQKLANWLFGK